MRNGLCMHGCKRGKTWNGNCPRLVDRLICGELGALNEAEDDGVLLADQGLPDVVQRQRCAVIQGV